jgi:DNA-binding transcriptional MerR regulator
MYTIGEASAQTGLSAHTLRFYEKEGILPFPKRVNGKDRVYTAQDVQFIQFICSLKSTGMSLQDIKEIVKEGCILEKDVPEISAIILIRKTILEKHLQKLQHQKHEIESVIGVTEKKLEVYKSMLI